MIRKEADTGCQSLFLLEAGKEEVAEEYTGVNLNMSHHRSIVRRGGSV